MKKSAYQAELSCQAPTAFEKQKMWERLEAAYDQEALLQRDQKSIDSPSKLHRDSTRVQLLRWRPVLSLAAVLALALGLCFLLPFTRNEPKKNISLEGSLSENGNRPEEEMQAPPVAVARYDSVTEAANNSLDGMSEALEAGIWTLETKEDLIVFIVQEGSEQEVELYDSQDRDRVLQGTYTWEAGDLLMTFDQAELTFAPDGDAFALVGRSGSFYRLEIDSRLSYYGVDCKENRQAVWQSASRQN